MSDSAVLCECAGMTKRYGSRTALADFSLSVRQGEVVALLGPNGAGKTTIFRLLTGFAAMTEGRAWVAGKEVPHWEALRNLSFVPEHASFYPWLSGKANLITLMAGPTPVSGNAATEALARVGLDDRAGDKVSDYSRGMRQRLAVALALASARRVALFDEPTNGLDPAEIVEFRYTLRELAATGTAVLLATHVLSEVLHVADRIVVLHQGRQRAEWLPTPDLEARYLDLVGESTRRTRLGGSLPGEVPSGHGAMTEDKT